MTKFQKYATIFVVAALAIIAFFLTYKVADHLGYKRGYNAYHPADTVVVIDTHTVYQPIEVEKWYEKEKLVYIPVHDTTTIHDSTYIAVPREVKQYQDSTYMAQVSGVDPSLDLIEVFQKTKIVTNYVEKKELPDWTLYLYGEATLPFNARAGFMYEKKVFDGFNYYLQTGYDYKTKWYIGAGVKIVLRQE